MNATTIDGTAALLTHGPDKAITLALSLAQAERAIHAFTAGQVDAIVDADGQPYLLRPAQTQLRQEASRLRAILDSSPDQIMVLNRAGVVVAQHGRVPALDREDLVGRSIFTLIHEDDLTKLYSVFFNIAEGLRVNATVQFRLQACTGAWLYVEATAAQLNDGASPQVLLILRPVHDAHPIPAERPRLRVPAVPPVAPAKDRFLSMLSHELRTPLTPILLGVAEMESDERFADAAPALAMIRRNVELQARLLDELMEFTLVGEHKVRLRLEPLDLRAHIGYVLETCQSELTAAQITVLLDFAPGSGGVMVCADSLRLQQVMWNLVKNAIKFRRPAAASSSRPPIVRRVTSPLTSPTRESALSPSFWSGCSMPSSKAAPPSSGTKAASASASSSPKAWPKRRTAGSPSTAKAAASAPPSASSSPSPRPTAPACPSSPPPSSAPPPSGPRARETTAMPCALPAHPRHGRRTSPASSLQKQSQPNDS